MSRSSLRRCRVVIERDTPIRTAAGGFTPGWAVIARPWAGIVPTEGNEFQDGEQIKADISHEISLPWTTEYTLTPRDRIREGTRVFNIRSTVNVGERNRTLKVMAREVV